MQDYLPGLGISHAKVVFFAPEDGDPVAWCRLGAPFIRKGQPEKFPSRQFPPAWLYPEEEPFSLALLPLVYWDEEAAGFVAFDAANLEPCAAIVRQPIAYLNRYRMKRTKELLEEGKSVTEAAVEAGFTDCSHFSRAFRRETGMSPRAYQRG
ncbi:MAG: helix-turn-helix domain-containing protein [Patescibacteria group bacterium]